MVHITWYARPSIKVNGLCCEMWRHHLLERHEWVSRIQSTISNYCFYIGGIRWNCQGPLIGKTKDRNSWKSSRERWQNQVYLGLNKYTNRYNAFWTNDRARGVRFVNMSLCMFLFFHPNGWGIRSTYFWPLPYTKPGKRECLQTWW